MTTDTKWQEKHNCFIDDNTAFNVVKGVIYLFFTNHNPIAVMTADVQNEFILINGYGLRLQIKRNDFPSTLNLYSARLVASYEEKDFDYNLLRA